MSDTPHLLESGGLENGGPEIGDPESGSPVHDQPVQKQAAGQGPTGRREDDGVADVERARHRLPRSILPVHYHLQMRPDLEAATFSGRVTIEAEMTGPAAELVLNAAELEVSSCVLSVGGQVSSPVFSLEETDERLVVQLPPEVAQDGDFPRSLSVTFTFSGTLNDQMRGFYRSSFVDEHGAVQLLATTQFESTDARRAFPCFDEPDAKARFSVSMDVPEGRAAVANGPVIETQELADGWRRVRFATTIPMSTYLVAFVVGPLVAVREPGGSGADGSVPLQVWCTAGNERLAGYALEVGRFALEYFTEWFGVPYPAEKLDLLAIPDFAAGAMENLGCVTFRESALLVDREQASQAELQRVADVVAHEIAHMWFGDLVTMTWWEGLWLNEAFANFMMMLCVDAFCPGWDRWAAFSAGREESMATDALVSTRPIEFPVGAPAEAEGMFDSLTYEKGAAVLRMLQVYLTPAVFQAGIRRYITTHAYANTTTADLWAALSEESGEPVGSVMDTWILTGGFPVISVRRGEGGDLELSQSIFRLSGGASASDGSLGDRSPAIWQVPLAIRSGETTARFLLGPDPLWVPGGPGPVVVNAGGTTYCRVLYSEELLGELAGDLGQLRATERANLAADTWAGVRAGLVPLEVFCRLVGSLAAFTAQHVLTDPDPEAWEVISSALEALDHLAAEEDRDLVARFTRGVVGPLGEVLGYAEGEAERPRVSRLRALVVRVLGTVGKDPEVQSWCQGVVRGGAAVAPDLAGPVVAVVAGLGERIDYDLYVERWQRAATPQDAERYLVGMARFDTAAALVASDARVALSLEHPGTPGSIRAQDLPSVLSVLIDNRETGPDAWARITPRWDQLVEVIGEYRLTHLAESAEWLCRDATLAREVGQFLESHPLESVQLMIDQSIERLAANAALAARVRAGLADALTATAGAAVA